jgi:hypothetical protein
MDMTKPFEGQLTGPCLLIRLADGGSLRGGYAAGAARSGLRQRIDETAIRPRGDVLSRFARYRLVTRRGGRSARIGIAPKDGSDAWP